MHSKSNQLLHNIEIDVLLKEESIGMFISHEILLLILMPRAKEVIEGNY